MAPTDRAFVATSLLQSYEGAYWPLATYAKPIREEYWRSAPGVVDPILDRATVDIFANPEHESQIMAWVCTEEDDDRLLLHYVYVKSLFRDSRKGDKLGLAKRLLEHVGIIGRRRRFVYTHKTQAWELFMERQGLKADYEPQRRIK